MIMLATQPSRPPTTIQIIKFIFDLQKVHQEKRLQPAAAFDDLKKSGAAKPYAASLPRIDLGHEQYSNPRASYRTL
jgi:hypothetical protein